MRNQNIRKLLATLFTGVYLFVVLFSQNLHNHGSGAVFKDFHFKKSEKSFSQSIDVSEFTDCLSCHILHDGKFLVPENFSFDFTNIEFLGTSVSEIQYSYHSTEPSVLFLRGPPKRFI